MWENIFLLILTAIIKIGLTAWTFGMMVRPHVHNTFSFSRIYYIPPDTSWYLSANNCHRCMPGSRSWVTDVSLLSEVDDTKSQSQTSQGLYRAYPTAWIFLSCPPDPSERCISPGFYAVLGASAMLGGVTRMTSEHTCYCPEPHLTRCLLVAPSSLFSCNRV